MLWLKNESSIQHLFNISIYFSSEPFHSLYLYNMETWSDSFFLNIRPLALEGEMYMGI